MLPPALRLPEITNGAIITNAIFRRSSDIRETKKLSNVLIREKLMKTMLESDVVKVLEIEKEAKSDGMSENVT